MPDTGGNPRYSWFECKKKHHMGKISGTEGLFSQIHMAALAGAFPFFCKQAPCFSNVPVNSKLGQGIPSLVEWRLDREI